PDLPAGCPDLHESAPCRKAQRPPVENWFRRDEFAPGLAAFLPSKSTEASPNREKVSATRRRSATCRSELSPHCRINRPAARARLAEIFRRSQNLYHRAPTPLVRVAKFLPDC